MTSIPSANFTPWISFGNRLWPSVRRQLFCVPSTSLKTMARAVLFDRQPFDRMVACRTVARLLSMGIRRFGRGLAVYRDQFAQGLRGDPGLPFLPDNETLCRCLRCRTSMLLPGRRSLAEFVRWYKTPKNSPAFFAAGLRRSIAAKGDGQQQSTISCRHQRTVGVRRPEDGSLELLAEAYGPIEP